MNKTLETVSERLLAPHGLALENVSEAADKLAGQGALFSDMYLQTSTVQRITVQKADQGSEFVETYIDIDRGVNARVATRNGNRLAFSNTISSEALNRTVQTVGTMGQGIEHALKVGTGNLLATDNVFQASDREDKVELARRIQAYARTLDPHVREVKVGIFGISQHVLVARPGGGLAADIRPLLMFNVAIKIERDGRCVEGGYNASLPLHDLAFLNEERGRVIAREALRIARFNLEATTALTGAMPVILPPGEASTLMMYTVGRALEAHQHPALKGYAMPIGKQVASSLCNIIDDGALVGAVGTMRVDDEGTATQRTDLIENGVLKGLMHDRLSAELAGVAPTGNGRRDRYSIPPKARRTNLRLLPGQSEPGEIIESVKRGIYCAQVNLGRFTLEDANFAFPVTEAYLIENGKITAPVSGAMLTGNLGTFLNGMSMVGTDQGVDTGMTNLCGTGRVMATPASHGHPTIRVDGLVIEPTV